MNQNKQEIDPFAHSLIEQRNAALNEAAYWRSQAVQFQARVMQLEAAAKPKEKVKKP